MKGLFKDCADLLSDSKGLGSLRRMRRTACQRSKSKKPITCLEMGFYCIESNLFHVERQQGIIFDENFEFIANDNFTDAGWRTRKNDIADIHGKEIRDIGDNAVEIMDH